MRRTSIIASIRCIGLFGDWPLAIADKSSYESVEL
jgi:hypothetical protein